MSQSKFDRKISILPSTKYKELKAMSFSYHQIHDELLINRIYLHTELEYTFPSVDELYKDNLSKYVLNILEEYPHPSYVKAHSRTKIKNFIKKQTKKRICDQQIMKKTEWLPEFALLESISGIDKLTSALLLAELGDIQWFKTNKQLNAFVGIDIRRYQSGTIYKRACMILYYTIQNMIKWQKYIENQMIDYYYKLLFIK